MMPNKDGFTVAAEVRGDGTIDPQPHIIMVTAEGRESDRDRALGAGINEFLTKPFSPSDLLDRVGAALRG
jgi:DNA-binding response OmpR family regulator